MPTLTFIIVLSSSAMLLLFGVHLVRTGIERLWGPQLRDWIGARRSHVSLLAVGTSTAFIMQGGTAVLLMVAGLAGSGLVPVLSATVIAIGAELGSAFALVFLSFPITGLAPIFILMGGVTYLWGKAPPRRAAGRILLGLGLLFLAISQIKSTAEPFQDFSTLSQIAGYLNSDIVAAAILGLFLTVAMHSSVAALITAVAFSASAMFEVNFGLGFVLGANIGSALIPLWLLSANADDSHSGWDVALAVAKLRIGLAVLLLIGLLFGPNAADHLPPMAPSTAIIAAHLAFNAVMLLSVFALPLVLPRSEGASVPSGGGLSHDVVEPEIQPILYKKKVLAMVDGLAELLDSVFAEPPNEADTAKANSRLNNDLHGIRDEYANLSAIEDDWRADLDRQMDFATRIGRSGSILAGRLFDDRLRGVRFSSEGRTEVERLVSHVKGTIVLAQEVLATGDVKAARLLVERKQSGTDAEQTSRENHYLRLQRGNQASLSSSDEHLEAIASLKEVNSKLCTIAYAILDAEGALKKSRLRAVSKIKEATR
ncbi:Na/Pi symporter [uncultured Roseobacter sp.]|uniref:Na/Pi cotransporter family protein n=1 Tax=uncultured Roseobacter sp. TaxID=114847 RepID=UPI0026112BD3|nr:Na/Pi symporter [uncultured Roseobacter sp.]